MKLLGLIQKWGLNFEDKKNDLPNFYSVYNKLRNSNVQFPNNFESSYQIYISDSRNNYKNNRDDNRNDEYENENSDKDDKDGETFYYMESLKNVLKVPNFEHKYRRLVNFLVKMHDNIQMANLLIDSRERSGLKDIINTLREGNNTLIDTISGGRLKDEKLMEITLGTTEDINQTLSRDEDVKTGYKPKKFTSYFVLNNVIPIKNKNNYKSRAKSTKPKKSIQRRDEKYKNYDMDLNTYDRNKYKEKIGSGGPKNVDDIFDLFSTPTNLSNEPGYNQPINNFFSSQTQIRGNNNNQMPQLTNNPLNNIFRNNNGSNNNNINSISSNNNNFQGNNMNNSNNFRNQFNQNKNKQMPAMNNFDMLEQKLKTINMEQNSAFNFNSQSTQFNPGFNNTNMNNNLRYTNNNNNNDNLMSMLDKLGPSPQSNSNQLTPYIGGFNQNNNYNNNNNNQFNNFNNNMNNNQINNNFNNNGNNNNNFNNNQNYNFNNNNQSNNFNNSGNNFNNNNNFNNTQFNNMNNNQNNNFGNNNNSNNDGNMFNFGNNNNNQMGMSQNMNNNFGMGQNSNQQMSLEEMEKQRKLKELDELF